VRTSKPERLDPGVLRIFSIVDSKIYMLCGLDLLYAQKTCTNVRKLWLLERDVKRLLSSDRMSESFPHLAGKGGIRFAVLTTPHVEYPRWRVANDVDPWIHGKSESLKQPRDVEKSLKLDVLEFPVYDTTPLQP
jgi:hypothetical protein